MTSGRYLRVPKVRAFYFDRYPAEVLDRLGPSLADDRWWLSLLRKRKSHDPAAHTLHHVLLQTLLGLNRDCLVKPIPDPKPFGEGPWPCLNPAASHYLKLRIPDVEVKYDHASKPFGEFACSCGFVYRRGGPDLTPEDFCRRGRVLEYGPVWLRALRRYWTDSELTLIELSRQLGFDKMTVAKRAKELGLPGRRSGVRPSRRAPARDDARGFPTFAQLRQAKRDAWKKELRDFPEATVTELRKRPGSAYAWLYRYDRDWYVKNKPAPRDKSPNIQTVDWERRDLEMLPILRSIAKELREREDPFVRASVSRIMLESQQMRRLRLNQNKMPRSVELLEGLTESQEDFVVRKIERIAEKVRDSGQRVSRNDLARLIGCRRHYLRTCEKVKKAFEQACEALGLASQWAQSS